MEIGPAVPPHLAKKLPFSEKRESVKDELELDTRVSINQRVRPRKSHEERERRSKRPSEARTDTDAAYGPLLPPEFEPKLVGEGKLDQLENKTGQDNDEDECYGPALPPGFQKNNEDQTFRRVVRQKGSHDSDSDSDYDVIGPMPPASSDIDVAFARTKLDIEARSQATREQMMGKKDAILKREMWMTELPPDLSKNFGLGPRKFRTRVVELGDQSVWTDTPSEKARKLKEGEKRRSKHSAGEVEPERTTWELKRDHIMGQQVENYNKRHRQESLVDMHKKKLKKEKEQKNKTAERRPFDRDKDLNLPTLSAGQKRTLIEKSKELGSRFRNATTGSSFL